MTTVAAPNQNRNRLPKSDEIVEPLSSRAAKALNSLDPTRRAKVQAIARTIPRKWRANFLAAAAGTASPRQAIAANCRACMGYDDVAEGIAGCTSTACPLWAYRRPGGQS